ncbi:hypothetical protein OAJ30_01125 [Alphaproteobacteria bacterium]|nr:hypothetical protein [Alphaproteobacteria bacterium]
MKTFLTLFVLFFTTSISFNSYAGFFDKTICIETDAQIRDGIVYLPNETEPFTGKNLCEYENSQTKIKGEFKEGKIDGEFTKWYQNGQVEINLIFKDGRPINAGKVTAWDQHGQQQINGEFFLKCLDSILFKFIYIDNWVYEIVKYKNNEKFSSTNFGYYNIKKEGQLMYEEIHFKKFQDYKKTHWFENGQKWYEDNYKNGKKHGKHIVWYENGQIKEEINFIDGITEGKWTTWYENGQMKEEKTYKDGLWNGSFTKWDDNGQIAWEAHFIDDELVQGRWHQNVR